MDANPPQAVDALYSEAPPDGPLVAPNNSARARVAQWIIGKSKGMKNTEIAAQMGIANATLSTIITRARKAGWLVLEQPEERLEFELLPMAVNNLAHFLAIKDKQVSIEVAKGAGLLKTHQAVKIDGEAARTNLQLNIQINGAPDRTTTNIVGKPKYPIDITPIKDE